MTKRITTTSCSTDWCIARPSRWRVLALIAALIVCSASDGFAALIQLKGERSYRRAFIVRQDGITIEFDELLRDGTKKRRSVKRNQIDDILVAVDAERLGELDPSKPQHYRDYADELAEKRLDPEAQTTAIRLYLIAAFLDSEKHGRSALLAMISLARSRNEEARFRALAFLLNPDDDSMRLKKPGFASDKPARPRSPDKTATLPATTAGLLSALVELRHGNADAAKRFASSGDAEPLFTQLGHVLTFEQFAELANSKRPISNRDLRTLVRAELVLEKGEKGTPSGAVALSDSDSNNALKWSMALDRNMRLPFISFTNVTEFDPAACLFRDGVWKRP